MLSVLAFAAAFLAQTDATAVVGGTVKFTEMLVRYDTLMITGAAWTVIQTIQKMVPNIADHPIASRMKPGASLFLCTALAFLPSWRVEGSCWDETLLYGIVIGGTLSSGHKILGQTILGKDRRVKPYVEDPELRKIIDEYVQAKESGDTADKKKAMDHLRNWLT